MTKVYMRHIRKCRYCSGGFIRFCRERGFDYKSFLNNGIEIEDLRAFMGKENHALVERVIRLAERENS